MFDFDKYNEVINEELKTLERGSWVNSSFINEDNQCVFFIESICDDMYHRMIIGDEDELSSRGVDLHEMGKRVIGVFKENVWRERNPRWSVLNFRDGGSIFVKKDEDGPNNEQEMELLFELNEDETLTYHDINKQLKALRDKSK